MNNEIKTLLDTLNFTLKQLDKAGIKLYDRQNYEYYVSKFYWNEERYVFEFDTELDEEELERTCDMIRIEHKKSSSLTTTKACY